MTVVEARELFLSFKAQELIRGRTEAVLGRQPLTLVS